MPRDDSWNEIYHNFQRQYCPRSNPDCDPSQYYAWLRKNNFDDKKPRSTQMTARLEIFDWVGDVNPDVLAGTANKVRFRMIHAGCVKGTNPATGETGRVCRSPEEMKMGARSGAMRPILIAHGARDWKGDVIAGWTLDSDFEDVDGGAVTAWGFLNDRELWELVRDRKPPFSKGAVSVGDVSRRMVKNPDGSETSVGWKIREVSLVPDDMNAGDPRAGVETFEALGPVIESRWETILSEKNAQGSSTGGTDNSSLLSGFGLGPTFYEAVWDVEFINNLPDNAFAGIEPGGTKDSEGKTTPRGLRHLPHHGTDGSVDRAHLANANARANQVKGVSAELRSKMASHLEDHKKELKVGSFSESADMKLQWERYETLMGQFGLIEDSLYSTNTRLGELEPRVSATVNDIFNKELARHELGKFLNIFGPRLQVMQNDIELVKQAQASHTCGGAKAQSTEPPSQSDLEAFKVRLEALFGSEVHVEHLPPSVSRMYLRDFVMSDRKRILKGITGNNR